MLRYTWRPSGDQPSWFPAAATPKWWILPQLFVPATATPPKMKM